MRDYLAFKPGFRYVQISNAMQVYSSADLRGIEVKEGFEEVASSKSGLPGFMSTVRRAPAARLCFSLCFELLTLLN